MYIVYIGNICYLFEITVPKHLCFLCCISRIVCEYFYMYGGSNENLVPAHTLIYVQGQTNMQLQSTQPAVGLLLYLNQLPNHNI